MQQDQYWQRLNGDLNSLAGNTVRDFIIAELLQYLVSYGKDQQGLTAQGKRDLAESVVQFALRDRFDGDWVRMKGTNWCSVMASGTPVDSDPYNTEKPVFNLLSDRSEIPDAVLNRYITPGKSQQARINGKRERITPVLYMSLTGFKLHGASNPQQQCKAALVKPLAVPVVAVTVPVVKSVAVPDIAVQKSAPAKSNIRSYISKR
jgi:hypothetical protein